MNKKNLEPVQKYRRAKVTLRSTVSLKPTR